MNKEIEKICDFCGELWDKKEPRCKDHPVTSPKEKWDEELAVRLDELYCSRQAGDIKDHQNRWEEIKSFIHTQLLSLIEEIEKGLPEEQTRENTIPSIANNPRFIETMEQQNLGFNACLAQVKELLEKTKNEL